MTAHRRLRRAEAAEYIRQTYAIPCATATLAKYACLGGGPLFRKVGARIVLYEIDDLDKWANEKLGIAIEPQIPLE